MDLKAVPAILVHVLLVYIQSAAILNNLYVPLRNVSDDLTGQTIALPSPDINFWFWWL